MPQLIQFFVASNFQINAALEKAQHLRIEKLNKHHGAYLSKYGTDIWTFVVRKKSY